MVLHSFYISIVVRSTGSERIDNILIEFHLARFHICGEVDIHFKWLVVSNKTDEDDRLYRDYRSDIKRISSAIFFTSCSDKFLAKFLPHMSISDYLLVSVKIDPKTKAASYFLFHRTFFRYTKTEMIILYGGSITIILIQERCFQNCFPDPFFNGKYYSPSKFSTKTASPR